MRSLLLHGLMVLLLAAGYCSVLAADATPAAPTAADFGRQPQYISAKISPDGRYLAIRYPLKDVTALGIIDVDSRKITATLSFSHQQHVADVWWVSPKRVVVAMGKSFGPLDQPALTGELYGMDADGRGKAYLHGYQGGIDAGTHISGSRREYSAAYMVDPMPQDPDHALIAVVSWRNESPSYQLYQLDVNKGTKQTVSSISANYLSWGLSSERKSVVTDVMGQPRYALGRNEDGTVNEYLHDLQTQKWTLVQKNEKHTQIFLLGLSDDARTLFLVSDRGGDRTCLRSRDLVNLELKTLACNERVDFSGVPMLVGDRRPAVVSFDDGRPLVDFIERDSIEAKLYKTLLKSFPDQRVDITSTTLDGRKMVVSVSSDRNPLDYYLFDLNRMKADYLFSPRPWIDPQQMSPSTPIDVKARDGRLLSGYLTSPSGIRPEKRPLVVMPHGGPHGIRDVWEWDPWAQYLASLGYAVLQVNYRGSGGYGWTFLHDGYHHWGTTMQDDLSDAVAWAVQAGIADRGRICIMGGSYGGYAALMSAVKEPDLYRCAIGLAGVYDLVTQSRDSDIASSRLGREYLNEAVGASDDELRTNSPITYLERLKGPVLIAHGTADERVPFSQAKELRKELDRLSKSYVWMPFDGEEHGFYVEDNHVKFLEAVKVFLAQNIGTASRPQMAPHP